MKNYYNALTFDKNIMKCAGSHDCSRINFIGEKPIQGADTYIPVAFAGSAARSIYIDDITNMDMADKAIELKSNGAKLILMLSTTLYEVGACDKRYNVTPVGLAHKLGLLEGALVSGAVHLDKDDIDLIIQSNAEIILTPSTSLGSGHGIPPVRMMLSLGATVHLGTGLPEYNPAADLSFESKLISLAASGALCTKNAVSENEIKKMLGC